MAADHQTLRHHGRYVDRNPLAEDATAGGPPGQSQDWPGRDQAMQPQATSWHPGHATRTRCDRRTARCVDPLCEMRTNAREW
jgi:hypothetical protein